MDVQKIQVGLEGLADICFDKFFDHSKEIRPANQKLYLAEGNIVVLPASNIRAFLFGENPQGCAKTFEGKPSKNYIRWGQGHVHIDPPLISFLDKGKPIVFDGFKKKFWILQESTRTKKSNLSVKQPIQDRPVLRLPWNLEFMITIVENPLITGIKLLNWFEKGVLMLGLANYRPRFGRFMIRKWEED